MKNYATDKRTELMCIWTEDMRVTPYTSEFRNTMNVLLHQVDREIHCYPECGIAAKERPAMLKVADTLKVPQLLLAIECLMAEIDTLKAK